MSLAIGILEDEPLTALHIQEMVAKHLPNVRFAPPLGSVSKSIEFLRQQPHPDLLLMDIHLSDGSCFEIFDEIDIDVPIIFITSYAQYALKAFEANSIDYLLKPVGESHLKRALDKFEKWEASQTSNQKAFVQDVQQLQQLPAYKNRFLVKTGNTYQFVKGADISVFFSENSVTHIQTYDGIKLPFETSLDKLELQLDPTTFFRINRKTLVNIGCIHRVHSYFNSRLKIEPLPLLKPHIANTDFVVSRDRTSRFKEWLNGQ